MVIVETGVMAFISQSVIEFLRFSRRTIGERLSSPGTQSNLVGSG
jgi:hypothetical protein